MTRPVILVVLIGLAACAQAAFAGMAEEVIIHGSNESYLVACVTETRVIVELRAMGTNRLIDDTILTPNGGASSFEFRNVTLGKERDLLVTTHWSGTGVTKSYLDLYTVIGRRLIRVVRFLLKEDIVASPVSVGEVHDSGTVSFGNDNRIIYTWRQRNETTGKDDGGIVAMRVNQCGGLELTSSLPAEFELRKYIDGSWVGLR